MPPMTDNDKKVRDAKRVIKRFREQEPSIKDGSRNRSTNLRAVYKTGWETLKEVEAILGSK